MVGVSTEIYQQGRRPIVFSISYVSHLQKLQNPWRYYESLYRQKEAITICGENQLPDIICAQECPFVFPQQKLEVAAYTLL